MTGVMTGVRPDPNYKIEYFKLFSELIKTRFRALDGEIVSLQVENNAIFNEQELQKIIDDLYLRSETNNYRRPSNKPIVKLCSKQTINLALPDCLLGVLGDYIFHKEEFKEDRSTAIENKFEQLRPKFRCIQFHSNKTIVNTFTVKKPFHKSYFTLFKGAN